MSPNSARLNRLRWHCRRGMRELDVLLVGYLDQIGSTMQADDEALFERLLEQTDMDLYAWFTGRGRPSDNALARLIEQILGLGVHLRGNAS